MTTWFGNLGPGRMILARKEIPTENGAITAVVSAAPAKGNETGYVRTYC